MRFYVVTQPESIRGTYDNWPACQAAVSGVAGARYQAVPSRAEADNILKGLSISLPSGIYAFVDGNHLGGIGIVFVQQLRGRRKIKEISTTVDQVFGESAISHLSSGEEINAALGRLRNILAELGGLYEALHRAFPKRALTVVHDYQGIEAWLSGRWRTKDPTVQTIVSTCRDLIAKKHLDVTFRHQRGHESTFLSKNDFARYNAEADRLASQAFKPAYESFYTESTGASDSRVAATAKGLKEKRKPNRRSQRRGSSIVSP